MDHRSSAREILSAIGGKENLVSAAHCATRLRLIIADNSKIQKDTLENIDVVKGVFEASGQLQIIIGTGTVNKVYDEFIAEAGVEASSKDEVKAQVAQKQNWFKRLIKTLGDVFVPIIPAIVAGGLIMGIMEALNFMASNGFISLDTNGYVFTIFKLLSNAAFTFLPILIGYSATKVFGGNPYLGAVIGMFLIHPDLQNAWTISTKGYEQTFSIFGLFNVHMVGYQGHVIPIIIASFILATMEKKLHKKVPDIVDLFVTPLVSLTVTAFLVYTFIGPVFVALENGIITAPLSGKAVKLENVPDQTFAQGILGLGAAIEPTEGKVVAPGDGKVETLFDTFHAVGLTLDNGKELLIHVGINTVELKGEGFKAYVSEGDRVTKGQTLITFDMDFIKSKGYQTVTPVLVSNSDDFASVEPLAEEGSEVSIGDKLIKVTV